MKALEQAEAQLITCSANPQHRYGSHLSHCPWCDRARKLGGRDPFPRSSQEVGRLQRIQPRKPRVKKRPLTPPVPQAVGYTISFASPHSLSKIPSSGGGLAQLKADLSQYFWEYRYDFLGGSLVIALALSAGLYLSDWPGDRASTPQPSPQTLSTTETRLDPPDNEAATLTLTEDASLTQSESGEDDFSLRLGNRRYDHGDRVTSIAVSPTGDWFASSSEDGTLKIWSFPDRVLLQSRRLSSVLGLPEDQVQVLAVGANGDRLVGATSQGLQTWNPATFDLINALPLPVTPNALSLAGQEHLQMGGTTGGDIAIWDIDGLRERRRWPGNAQDVLALSPDGQTLVTAGAGDISLWNVETGQRQATLPQEPPENLVVALSPDSRLLAMTVPADNGVIQIWDTTTGALITL